MLQPIDLIREYLVKVPPPWRVTMWTMPADGRSPAEYTAGYFSIIADKYTIPDEGPITLYKEMEGVFVIVPPAIGVIEELVEGGIRFTYKNLNTTPGDFKNDTVVTITIPEIDGGD